MRLVSLLLTAFLVLPVSSHAQYGGEPQTGRQAVEQFNAMTPEQRAAAVQKAQEQWKTLTPAERKQVEAQVQETWNSLSEEEKKAQAQQAMQQWQNMTPEQQRQLQQQFPDMLKGGIQLQRE